MLDNLPEDILRGFILPLLGPLELSSLAQSCNYFYTMCYEEGLWKQYCFDIFATPQPGESYRSLFASIFPNIIVVDPALPESKNFQIKGFRALFRPLRTFGACIGNRGSPRRVAPVHAGKNAVGQAPESFMDLCRVYSSISKAIAQGRNCPGMPYILIRPGRYEEAKGILTCERSCVLVGASNSPQDVVIGSRAFFQTGNQVVRNIEFSGFVEVKSSPTFSSCFFLSGMTIKAPGFATVQSCTVRDGRSYGILVNGGAARINDCDIFQNMNAGVIVQDTSKGKTIIKGNHIHNGNGNGILVSCLGDDCIIEGNDIHTNSFPGIVLKQSSAAIIRSNKIYKGNWGIVVKEKASGQIVDNELYSNRHSAICVQTTGSPSIMRNTIHHEKRGIVVTGSASDRDRPSTRQGKKEEKDGLVTICDNCLSSNFRSAISIKNGGNPSILRNTIHGGRWGIVVQKDAHGIIKNNDIYGNSRPGIGIKTSSDPVVRNNRIHSGGTIGIIVNENGNGIIESNEIYGNKHSGIMIKSGGKPRVTRNRIHNEKRGVDIAQDGSGIIEFNEIYDSMKTGISMKKGSTATIRYNVVRNCLQGLTVYESAIGLVEANEFFSNQTLDILVHRGGLTTFAKNLTRRRLCCPSPIRSSLPIAVHASTTGAVDSQSQQPQSTDWGFIPSADPTITDYITAPLHIPAALPDFPLCIYSWGLSQAGGSPESALVALGLPASAFNSVVFYGGAGTSGHSDNEVPDRQPYCAYSRWYGGPTVGGTCSPNTGSAAGSMSMPAATRGSSMCHLDDVASAEARSSMGTVPGPGNPDDEDDDGDDDDDDDSNDGSPTANPILVVAPSVVPLIVEPADQHHLLTAPAKQPSQPTDFLESTSTLQTPASTSLIL